jgi:outer membrane protein OmpA-like peptidoglycan-associated protein
MRIVALCVASMATPLMASEPGTDCPRAADLLEVAQQGSLADALDTAQQAVELCDAFETRLFLGHAYSVRGDWDRAEDAYLRARGHAGADISMLTQAETRYALSAASSRPPCEGLAILEVATEAISSRGFPVPARVHERRLEIEAELTAGGLDSAAIGCVLDTKLRASRVFLTERAFCAAAKVDLPVHFDTDSHSLGAEGRRQIDALVGALKIRLASTDRLQVVGHTDERGEIEYNQRLSERRAQTVAQALSVQMALESSRLITAGRGEEDPKHDGHSEEYWRLNRRVEITILPESCAVREGT